MTKVKANTTAAATAATTADKPDAWPQRFGKLIDVQDRESIKGPYATFKAEGNGFDFYGACFDEQIIAQMKAAVGQRVWMRGPNEPRMVDGVERKSFKVIYFKISDAKGGEDAPASDVSVETEAEAA